MQSEQLLLFDIKPDQEPDNKTSDQRSFIENFLAQLRIETAERNYIGKELFGDSWLGDKKTKDLSLISAVTSEWHKRKGINPHNSLGSKLSQTIDEYKPHKSWNILSKQNLRRIRLYKRAKKKFTLPDLYIDFILQECFKNPNYYGLCMLPTVADRCPIH